MPNKTITLHAEDDHHFDAYYCQKNQSAVGIIVIQEIFGVTPYIKNTCEYWADKGYQTIAPALYDRYERNVSIPYTEEGAQKALDYKDHALNWEKQLLDIDTAKQFLRQNGVQKVGVIGFSWGGTLSWLAASRLKNIECVSSYYGPHIFQFLNEQPQCPIELHLADKDELIPEEHILQIKKHHPIIPIYQYPVGHGFSNNLWYEYNVSAASLANERSEKLFKQYL